MKNVKFNISDYLKDIMHKIRKDYKKDNRYSATISSSSPTEITIQTPQDGETTKEMNNRTFRICSLEDADLLDDF